MAHSQEVLHADAMRRDRRLTWEEYRLLLRGKFVASAGELAREIALGIRDTDGRLKALQDLGGL